jgi:hypothetical protein
MGIILKIMPLSYSKKIYEVWKYLYLFYQKKSKIKSRPASNSFSMGPKTILLNYLSGAESRK